jgi:hypothetical protein
LPLEHEGYAGISKIQNVSSTLTSGTNIGIKMTAVKNIESRIKAKYQGEDGDWVIARGKVTEVKFLKEAVAEIVRLRHRAQMHAELYNVKNKEHKVLLNSIESREKAITEAEEKLQRHLRRCADGIANMQVPTPAAQPPDRTCWANY